VTKEIGWVSKNELGCEEYISTWLVLDILKLNIGMKYEYSLTKKKQKVELEMEIIKW
jgi:hypothetical protein